MSLNPVNSDRSRHIDTFDFLRGKVLDKVLRLVKVVGSEKVADALMGGMRQAFRGRGLSQALTYKSQVT